MSTPRLLDLPLTGQAVKVLVATYPLLSGSLRDYWNDESAANGGEVEADGFSQGSGRALVSVSLASTVVAAVREVRVLVRGRGSAAGVTGTLAPMIRTGGVEFYAPAPVAVAGILTAELEYTWSTNPQTGAAWTMAQLVLLHAGARITSTLEQTGERVRAEFVRARALVDVKVGRVVLTGSGRLTLTGSGRATLAEVA